MEKTQAIKNALIKQIIENGGNGSGIAEGGDLEAECFNLAQMPNRSTND